MALRQASVRMLAAACAAAGAIVGQPDPATAQPQQVALQSVQNGKYVRIGAGPHGYLAATSPQINALEKFYLAKLGGQIVALQSAHDASYVRAGVGSGSFLAAGSPHIKAWERFQLIELGGDRVALRSTLSGKYVRAGVGQESFLAATSPHIAAWETFRIVPIASQVQRVQTPKDKVKVFPVPTFTTPAPPAPPGLAPQMQAILAAHNVYRAKHCVPPLTWSATVAAAAQAWANTCPKKHSGGGYGENMWWGTAGAFSPESIVAAWYNELGAYDFNAPGFSLQTGHFTQVIWKGSTELGCGFATCAGLDHWVCNYLPPGNYQGQFPQNVPKQCKP